MKKYKSVKELEKKLKTFSMKGTPTIASLYLHLGISKTLASLWKEGEPEMSEALEKVKLKIEHKWNMILTKSKMSHIGAIFYLKNAFGYEREHFTQTPIRITLGEPKGNNLIKEPDKEKQSPITKKKKSKPITKKKIVKREVKKVNKNLKRHNTRKKK